MILKKSPILLYLYLKQFSVGFDSNAIDEILYIQLKEYELRFGLYIKNLQSESDSYSSNAAALIDTIAGQDDISYLTTFNYSSFPFNGDVWHINGDVDNPIFGVDYSNVNPNRLGKYHYSKTYRRLELSGKDLYLPKKKDYRKVVVFGHSLNAQDYNFFFSLFNAMKFGSDRSDKLRGYTIEFCYSGYGDVSSEESRTEIVSRTIKMLHSYNDEILHEPNFRLMDILFCTGALRFREI